MQKKTHILIFSLASGISLKKIKTKKPNPKIRLFNNLYNIGKSLQAKVAVTDVLATLIEFIQNDAILRLQACQHFPGSNPHWTQWDLPLSRHALIVLLFKPAIMTLDPATPSHSDVLPDKLLVILNLLSVLNCWYSKNTSERCHWRCHWLKSPPPLLIQ